MPVRSSSWFQTLTTPDLLAGIHQESSRSLPHGQSTLSRRRNSEKDVTLKLLEDAAEMAHLLEADLGAWEFFLLT